MVRVVLGVVAMVVIGALVIVALTRDGDSEEPAGTAVTPPATARATGLTDARTAEPAPTTEPAPTIAAVPAITATPRAEYTPTPRETPVVSTPPPTPSPDTTQPLAPAPIPGAAPTPEPTPRIILVTPVGTATPYPTPYPTPAPIPTPDPDATPTTTPTPAPLPTPVTVPPNRVEGDIDPVTWGECLHCWIYMGPNLPTWGDPDHDSTEQFLRERYAARSARVERCDTCPMVLDPYNQLEAVTLLYPRSISGSTGMEWLVLSLTPVDEEQFNALIENELDKAIANGWVVPINESHHIRDVAGMIAYPLQPYPRHEPGAWALTWSGFEKIKPLANDTRVPTDDLSATPLDDECAICWRYPDGLSLPMRDFTEQHLAEVFPNGDSTAPACDTCPWMYDGSDLTGAIAAGSLAVMTPGSVSYITLGHPAPRLLDAAILRRTGYADYITAIGFGYSASQAARMIEYSGLAGPRFFEPGTWVVTNLGMEAIRKAAMNPPVPYTLVRSNPPALDTLPVSYCIAGLSDAGATAQLHALTREAIDRWNTATNVDGLILSGMCDTATPVARNNNRNEVFVDPSADGLHAGYAHYNSTDTDVSISAISLATPDCNMQTLTHEFGHVLGFDHGDEPRSVMYGGPRFTTDCALMTIQDWEVAQLREFWGFD